MILEGASLQPTINQQVYAESWCFQSFSHFTRRFCPEIRTESRRRWQAARYCFPVLCRWIRPFDNPDHKHLGLTCTSSFALRDSPDYCCFPRRKRKERLWGADCNKDGGEIVVTTQSPLCVAVGHWNCEGSKKQTTIVNFKYKAWELLTEIMWTELLQLLKRPRTYEHFKVWNLWSPLWTIKNRSRNKHKKWTNKVYEIFKSRDTSSHKTLREESQTL